MRVLRASLGLVVALMMVPGGLAAVSAHPSGLQFVGNEVMQSAAASDEQATALNAALQHAMDNRDVLGYPWLDPVENVLLVSESGPTASQRLRTFNAVGVRVEVRRSPVSVMELDRLTDDLVAFRRASDTTHLIWKLEPDEFNNRIIVTVQRGDDDLLFALAARFGTRDIAIRVDPNAPMAGTGARQNDISPFWGGAAINVPVGTCSTAFGWRNGTLWEGMLTAGHCAHSGGAVSTPAMSMGTVTHTTRENWDVGLGTQPWPGEPGTYRGDIALVTLYSSRVAGTFMYRGNATSSASSPVLLTWGRWSNPGDDVCTSGKTTGEICGWDVKARSVTMWYAFDGPGVLARNVVEAHTWSGCIDHGDSGGAVFTPYLSGVAAKGVISGFANAGPFGCYLYYTDIQHAVQPLPGGVKTQ